MVVGYQKLTGNTLVRPFVGLALGGRSADDSANGVRGDVLLGYSEYVTHTRWDEKSASLRHWPAARAVVRDLLSKMRDYFERNSRVVQPDENNDLTPLEEGLKFPGLGRIGPGPEPITGQPKLSLISFDRADAKYTFEIRVRVEANKPPCSLYIWVEPAVETGSATKEDRFSLEDIHTVPANLVVEQLNNGKVEVKVPRLEKDTQIKISGATAGIAPEIFAASEGLLKASLSIEPQLLETEQVGEDKHA